MRAIRLRRTYRRVERISDRAELRSKGRLLRRTAEATEAKGFGCSGLFSRRYTRIHDARFRVFLAEDGDSDLLAGLDLIGVGDVAGFGDGLVMIRVAVENLADLAEIVA
jgi:hypothetical protein